LSSSECAPCIRNEILTLEDSGMQDFIGKPDKLKKHIEKRRKEMFAAAPTSSSRKRPVYAIKSRSWKRWNWRSNKVK